MSINVASIKGKFDTYCSSSDSKISKSAISEEKAIQIVNMAGEELAQCISSALNSSGLTPGAIATVGSITPESAYKVSNGVYSVGVNIDRQYRESLTLMSSVRDMAALLNEGYSARKQVYGYWHGSMIGSLQERPKTDFVGRGIENFRATHGGIGYTIIDINTGDRFK